MPFPKNFVWGAATASYQIEGAATADGRGQTVWDMMCRKPGAVWSGHTGAVACDHYHRYAEDVQLMKQIGLQAYRFSVAWSRVLPDGVGTVNEKGLDFYDRLVDALIAAKITPYLTVFHWDFPQELFCQGGWLNRDSADWFADYAAILAKRLGDRVKHWITLNEPQCFIGLGLASGKHAPGLILPNHEVLRAGHHCLLAHGKGVQAIRANAGRKVEIGYAPVGCIKSPVGTSAKAIKVAKDAMFAITDTGHWSNTWWMDPVYLGKYPADGWALFGADVPPVKAGDLATIHQPLDFCGVNIYGSSDVTLDDEGRRVEQKRPVGHPTTAFRWEVAPAALRWGPRFLWERYQLPVYITENGLSCTDWVSLDGKVHDPNRIDFTQRYLLELEQAIADGAKVGGYFHWSLLDNFEWGEGYKERFGLVHVDYPTGTRTPKDSAKWYAKVIKTNGAALHA